jgi:lactate dehydrogenase-like 2-hydroxyacid dehydrogenase
MSDKPTLLALCGLEPEVMSKTEERFNIIKLYNEQNPEKRLNEVKGDVQGIIATMRNPVRSNLINACPNLEIIGLAAVGFDNVDLDAAKQADVIVTNTPDVVTNDTADTAMALLLNVTRRYTEGDAFVRMGYWDGGQRKPIGVTLQGKTLGIYGLGRIGKDIARKAEAFGLKIAYHGRHEQKEVPYIYYDDLETMASEVDILLCACPGGENTANSVNKDIFDAMKDTAYLVNIARGSVVNEADLITALKNDGIAGAGLDVYVDEPNVPQELKIMDNVVLFPHMGAATQETFLKIEELLFENLTLHFDGKPVKTPVQI